MVDLDTQHPSGPFRVLARLTRGVFLFQSREIFTKQNVYNPSNRADPTLASTESKEIVRTERTKSFEIQLQFPMGIRTGSPTSATSGPNLPTYSNTTSPGSTPSPTRIRGALAHRLGYKKRSPLCNQSASASA